jgi:dienelactone hydrolase
MKSIQRCIVRLMLSLLPLFVATPALAERVSLALRPNLTALADYHAGQVDKPAIIILHGFLQTHESPIVFHLASGLAGEGYSVLTPTLSLGVTHRRASLACEAIHSHTLADGVAELGHWVEWLQKRHKGPVVLVGHSLGSLTLLAYLEQRRQPPIRKAIGISIMEGRIGDRTVNLDSLLQDLKKRQKAGQRSLVKQSFAFCASMQASPESLLSYLEWTPQRVMASSGKHRAKIVYIMGGRDDRLGDGWLSALTKTGVKVKTIPGANHFMDGEFEFDLLDGVISELKGIHGE